MKATLLILSVLILISSVGAQEIQTLGGEDGFFPDTNINLIQICSNCTFVNITTIVVTPTGGVKAEGSIIRINSVMQKEGTFYNFTLEKGNTTREGEYIVNWISDGPITAGNYNLFVRGNATKLTTGESFLFFIFLIVSFAGSLFFLYFGFILPYSDKKLEDGTITRFISFKYLKLLGIWIGYGLLLWFMNLLTGIANNFVSLAMASNLIEAAYLILLGLAYPLTLVILSVLLIQFYWDVFVPLFKILLNKFGSSSHRRKQRAR